MSLKSEHLSETEYRVAIRAYGKIEDQAISRKNDNLAYRARMKALMLEARRLKHQDFK